MEGEKHILGFKEFWFAGRTRAEHLLLRISTGYCSVLLNRFTYLSRMSLVSERKEDNREMQRSLHIMPMAGVGSRFLKEG